MSPSSPEDGPSEPSGAAPSSTAAAHEPLACVSCRSRKLKCDRQKPVCARCAKTGGECVYPESRRKPAFKRRNVRELEDRLAQVEGLLRSVGRQRVGTSAGSDGAWTDGSSPSAPGGEFSRPPRPPQDSPRGKATLREPLSPTASPPSRGNPSSGELLGLGQFESLPPFEMIEELHTAFFATQQHFLPIIHPGNYLRAFHSPPHMRPPMALQYAIWTSASNGHPKYGCYHDALYRRARQYLEADELKGHGEHFITIPHAQAWALIATDEARCLLFTRASMSSARSVRLAGMMGLHRLDATHADAELPMAPMIGPPRNWAELEERRRLFWGGFCLDSYASISVGWPTLIDVEQITTHLPASEDAFTSSTEEQSFPLRDAFRGSSYSIFAGNVIISHVFTRLLKHAHRAEPDDLPQDPEFGAFWKRHRELDNMLSDGFLYLPERFRLPQNIRDPNAVQANLNLHAAVICLHIAAREKADQFKLAGIRQTSRTRLLTAAQEIIDILKASGDVTAGYRGPLMALSLYFAALVYIAQAKENMEDCNKANLEYLIQCMNSTARLHIITRAYLQQLLLDIERSGIPIAVDHIRNHYPPNKTCGRGVPPTAQMRHTKVHSPSPDRLPLSAPLGAILSPAVIRYSYGPPNFTDSYTTSYDIEGPASKRMRTSAGPGPGPHISMPMMWSADGVDPLVDPAPDLFEYTGGGWSYKTKYMTNPVTTLPHRMATPITEPLFPSFAMPNPPADPTPAFPHISPEAMATGFGFSMDDPSPTATTATTVTGDNTNPNTQEADGPDLSDLGMFDLDQPWSMAESLYALLDMSAADAAGGLSDPTAAAAPPSQQDGSGSGGMDPWAAVLNSGGAGGSSAGGGGAGGAWDAAGAGGGRASGTG
ncbi:hypothetical protein B0I37DRAFT_369719 [Chaetomium sp. MPI-CAGE-AT-0009]|nr:hypothetical protein B0I37DRAFT_369719 [Chaetomium sp. MPI-CAGE-AT-0009]